MRTWFRFQNAAEDSSVVDIHIIDFIGSWDDDWFARNWGYEMGVTARAFIEELARLSDGVKTINVHINSPGGDVQAGINIANALREQQVSKGRTVETFIDGIAASIASVIAMAGSKVHISDNALLMVHNPYSFALGNAAEMRKVADILDTIRGQIVNTYKWHSSLDDAALEALMDAETWMDADAAIANGLATDKVQGLSAAAAFDGRVLAKALKVPEKFKARVDALLKPEPAAPAAMAAIELVKACREAECFELADELLAANATAAQVTARIGEAKNTKAIAKRRADDITGICTTAKVPGLATGYINGAMSVEDVRAHVTTITAMLDKVVIDSGLAPDAGQNQKAVIDTAAVYADLNATKKKE